VSVTIRELEAVMSIFDRVQTRDGKLREIGWNAWGSGLGTVRYVNCELTCPLVVSGDGRFGSVTTLLYRQNHMNTLVVRRVTNLMGSGMKRWKVSGRDRVNRVDTLRLFDQTPFLSHVKDPAAWGYTEWHVTRGGKTEFSSRNTEPKLTAEQTPDFPRWFRLFHQFARGCWNNAEWSPLVDWLIETSPLIEPYLTQTGVL
jgi:hypothetical protein